MTDDGLGNYIVGPDGNPGNTQANDGKPNLIQQ